LTKLLGSTVDISPLLCFHFWECVYYQQSETSFPSDSKEGLGHIVGISEQCGHALMYKVLTADTRHVIYRSLVRPVTHDDANLRASMFVREPDSPAMTFPLSKVWVSPNLMTQNYHQQCSIHKI
jgi:hypothetical protein